MTQLALPGIGSTPQRPRTRHRYGTPSGEYALAACRSCTVRRRYGPFRCKGGYCHQWSRDGKEWSDVEIPCIVKRGG